MKVPSIPLFIQCTLMQILSFWAAEEKNHGIYQYYQYCLIEEEEFSLRNREKNYKQREPNICRCHLNIHLGIKYLWLPVKKLPQSGEMTIQMVSVIVGPVNSSDRTLPCTSYGTQGSLLLWYSRYSAWWRIKHSLFYAKHELQAIDHLLQLFINIYPHSYQHLISLIRFFLT